jgi:hypothetical protein
MVICLGLVTLATAPLVYIGEGALIIAVSSLAENRPISIGEAWGTGRRFAWTYFRLTLLQITIAGVFGMIAGMCFGFLGLLMSHGMPVAAGVPAFAVVVVASWIGGATVGIACTYAARAVALERVGAWAAVERGFELAFSRITTTLLLDLLCTVATGLLWLGAAAVLVVILILMAAMLTSSYTLGGLNAMTLSLVLVATLVMSTSYWACAAVIHVFGGAYWTLAYLRLPRRQASVADAVPTLVIQSPQPD